MPALQNIRASQTAKINSPTITASNSPTIGQIPTFYEYFAPAGRAGRPLAIFNYGYDTTIANDQWTVTPAANVKGSVVINVDCPPGYVANGYSEAAGVEWTCSACPSGNYNDATLTNQTSCLVCAAGTYSAAASTSCTACAENTYTDKAGSGACSACPDANMRTGSTGAASVSACKCPAGFFRPKTSGDGNTCNACGGNTVCTAENQELPLPAAGFFVNPDTGVAKQCTPASACLTHETVNAVQSKTCATGYMSVEVDGEPSPCDRCQGAPDPYYKSGTVCKKCENLTIAFIAGGFLILILLTPAFIKLAQKDVFGSVNIMVVFFQTTSVFSSFPWDWPPELVAFFQVLGFFNLDINLVRDPVVECWSAASPLLKKVTLTLTRLRPAPDPRPLPRPRPRPRPRSLTFIFFLIISSIIASPYPFAAGSGMLPERILPSL